MSTHPTVIDLEREGSEYRLNHLAQSLNSGAGFAAPPPPAFSSQQYGGHQQQQDYNPKHPAMTPSMRTQPLAFTYPAAQYNQPQPQSMYNSHLQQFPPPPLPPQWPNQSMAFSHPGQTPMMPPPPPPPAFMANWPSLPPNPPGIGGVAPSRPASAFGANNGGNQWGGGYGGR